jgi:hypothetical protein
MSNDTTQPKPAPKQLYFQKELVSVPFRAGGEIVSWEMLGENRGRLALMSDDPKAADLQKAASLQTGGILQVTAQQFEDAKKKYPYIPIRRKSEIQPIRTRDEMFPRVPSKKLPAAASVNPGVMEKVPGRRIPTKAELDAALSGMDVNSAGIEPLPEMPAKKAWRPDVPNPPATEFAPRVGKIPEAAKPLLSSL